MGIFSTTENLIHHYPLPPTTNRSAAIKALHNHDWMISLDRQMESYALIPSASSPPNKKSYRVVNDMPQIPKALHDAKVNIDVELTDKEDGVEALVYAPLGIVQTGDWKIVGEEGKLVLVVKTEISCSRLVMGIARGKAESNHPRTGDSFKILLKSFDTLIT